MLTIETMRIQNNSKELALFFTFITDSGYLNKDCFKSHIPYVVFEMKLQFIFQNEFLDSKILIHLSKIQNNLQTNKYIFNQCMLTQKREIFNIIISQLLITIRIIYRNIQKNKIKWKSEGVEPSGFIFGLINRTRVQRLLSVEVKFFFRNKEKLILVIHKKEIQLLIKKNQWKSEGVEPSGFIFGLQIAPMCSDLYLLKIKFQFQIRKNSFLVILMIKTILIQKKKQWESERVELSFFIFGLINAPDAHRLLLEQI
ncbi:hypothetical protein pb186bvf_020579 [Paramecium bursaria]